MRFATFTVNPLPWATDLRTRSGQTCTGSSVLGPNHVNEPHVGGARIRIRSALGCLQPVE
jgi:hypothetical protein